MRWRACGRSRKSHGDALRERSREQRTESHPAAPNPNARRTKRQPAVRCSERTKEAGDSRSRPLGRRRASPRIEDGRGTCGRGRTGMKTRTKMKSGEANPSVGWESRERRGCNASTRRRASGGPWGRRPEAVAVAGRRYGRKPSGGAFGRRHTGNGGENPNARRKTPVAA